MHPLPAFPPAAAATTGRHRPRPAGYAPDDRPARPAPRAPVEAARTGGREHASPENCRTMTAMVAIVLGARRGGAK